MASTKRERSQKGLQRYPQSYSMDKDIIEEVDNIVVERGGASKSQVVEHLVKLGLDVMRKENEDPSSTEAKKEESKKLPTILTFINFKGGVAKTTSVTCLAHALGEAGKKVLVIDFDAQGNTSMSFNVFDKTKRDPCIVDVLFSPGRDTTDGTELPKMSLEEVMQDTEYPNVKVVPCNMRFLEADSYIRNVKTGADRLLQYAIMDLKETFDYIIIDCGPRLDMTTTNCLVAMEAGNRDTSMVILPVKLDGYAIVGAPEVVDMIYKVARQTRSKPQPWRILITIAEGNTVAHEMGIGELEETINGEINYFKTLIPKSTKTNEASILRMPLSAYAPRTKTAKAYALLAAEIEAMHE